MAGVLVEQQQERAFAMPAAQLLQERTEV